MILEWLFGRRRKLLATPFPTQWNGYLQENVRHFAWLPADKQQLLRRTTQVIVGERTWVGVSGLEVTDEIKLTIAAQAALLLLGNEGYYFDKVSSILVHPRSFQNRTTNADLHKRFDRVLPVVGEAHQFGTIVLTWPEVLAGGRRETQGTNLVLHELAHHLDSLDGEMAGMPPLPNRQAIARWKEVIDAEYKQLVDDVRLGRPGVLDDYGVSNKAEFFAVATECFYELPRAMQDELPRLYELLRDFYRIDPSQWWPDAI